jgi:ankyrin repeat protein
MPVSGAPTTHSLQNASVKGHMEIVRMLLAKNPDLNVKDAFGMSALMSAVTGYS